MDRAMWQEHLLHVSRLFVEHTKHFMQRNGIRTDSGSGGQIERRSGPKIKDVDRTDSGGSNSTDGECCLYI